MSHPSFASRFNLELIEEYYRRWQAAPESVDERWQAFFEGFDLANGMCGRPGDTTQTQVVRMVFLYRNLGHLSAHLDPLSPRPESHPFLTLKEIGLTEADLDRVYDCSAFAGLGHTTLRELRNALEQTYCGTVGVEYLHILDTPQREWIKERVESRRMRPDLPTRQKLRTLMTLHYAGFRAVLHPVPGPEAVQPQGALIPILDAMVGPRPRVKEFVVGMAHRVAERSGQYSPQPYQSIFAEFEDNFTRFDRRGRGRQVPPQFSGDVATSSVAKSISADAEPGATWRPWTRWSRGGRAKLRAHGDKERKMGIRSDPRRRGLRRPGDRGRTLNLANLEGYDRGTIHVIVNNQIGFTTSPADAARRRTAPTSQMIQAPIFT